MEFWGVEVPAGKPTTCLPGERMYLHVSQAALGESKDKSGKGNARVVLKVQVDDSEVVLGTLTEGKCDQMPLDLVFDREFTVSHNSNSSSVYICGYRTEDGDAYDPDEEDDDEEEDIPVAVEIDPIDSNGAAAGKQTKAAKIEDVKKTPDKAQVLTNSLLKVEKKTVKKQVVESSDEEDESDDEDEGMGHPFVSDLASESDDEFDAGDDSDEDVDEDDDDEDDEEEDDEDESDESEEEELKIEVPKLLLGFGKKRSAEELTKSAEKKSKTDASLKPGQSPGIKGGKTAPVTLVGKAAAPAESKTPTDKGLKPGKAPKSTPTAPPTTPVSEKKIGAHKCTGCDRTFMTESAMSQHVAAKHGAKA